MQQWLLRGSQAVGLLLVLVVTLTSTLFPGAPRADRTAELAFRQVAHEYLRSVGDSTARIPAVVLREDGSYFLPLQRHVHYDSLVAVSQAVFPRYGIEDAFSLSLEDCASEEIFLGAIYHTRTLAAEGQPADDAIACLGRDQEVRCANIRLGFLHTEPPARPVGLYGLGILGLFLLVTGTVLNRRARNAAPSPSLAGSPVATAPVPAPNLAPARMRPNEYTQHSDAAEENELAPKPALIRISADCELDENALLLTTGAGAQTVTYREAKLLSFLAAHPNEVLSRATIHDGVWGEEGVITGRSLDVFVSRLRKKLAGVAGVEIQTVHGLGYRFLTG